MMLMDTQAAVPALRSVSGSATVKGARRVAFTSAASRTCLRNRSPKERTHICHCANAYTRHVVQPMFSQVLMEREMSSRCLSSVSSPTPINSMYDCPLMARGRKGLLGSCVCHFCLDCKEVEENGERVYQFLIKMI